MRVSTSSIIIIIFVFAITLIVVITWFPLNNIPRFNGEFLKVLNIAIIKPTLTAAAYHKSFYKFYFLYSGLPPRTKEYYIGSKSAFKRRNE
jgi:hypothetical protein